MGDRVLRERATMARTVFSPLIRIAVGATILSLSTLCLAAARAGPQAADEALRQNPQIRSLPGVPGGLRGDNIQDCPAGGPIDVSRSRCVVAYLPGTDNVYVFGLYPNTSKVWFVLKTDRAYRTSVYLGAFDVAGHIAKVGPGSSTQSVDAHKEPPRNAPVARAAQPQAVNGAPAQTTISPSLGRSSPAEIKANGPQLTAATNPINTADSSAIGARPIQATNPRENVTMRGGPYAASAPWGTELRFNCVGAWPNGETIVPNGFELKNSARSGKYADNALPNDRLLEFLNQVQQFLLKSCADKGHPVSPNATLYLFTDGLPASYGHGYVVFAARDARRNSWTVQNLAADSYIREQEQTAAAAARQKAEAERQVQEAERRRVTEQAEKERRAVEKQRQDQVAAAQATAQAEAQKKVADRGNAQRERLEQFWKKHNLVAKKTKGLYANPFAFEGDSLFLPVAFEQMQSATTGLFYLPDEGILVVNDIPKGAFLQKGKVLLAAKVLGNVKFDGVLEGIVQVHGMVPNLKFLGALICRDDQCEQMNEK